MESEIAKDKAKAYEISTGGFVVVRQEADNFLVWALAGKGSAKALSLIVEVCKLNAVKTIEFVTTKKSIPRLAKKFNPLLQKQNGNKKYYKVYL